MAFSVSSLTDYVDQSSEELLTLLQFEGETAKQANLITGVKSSRSLQILTNTVNFQDGDSDCAFNASGTTDFAQRNIVTKGIKVQEVLCPRALQAKWTQLLLRAGQKYDESDIPKLIIQDYVKQILKKLETLDWTGSTTGTFYDGLIKIIKAESTTQVATSVAGPVTTSNVRTIVQNCLTKVPAAYKGDPAFKFFMGYDIAELYRQKMFTDNLYHFPANGDQKGINAEGSNHEIIPVHGLDGFGSNAGDNPFIFGMDPVRNLYLGVDMDGEEEKPELWYSQDDQNVKFSFRFRRGWQIAFPSEIVEYSNT